MPDKRIPCEKQQKSAPTSHMASTQNFQKPSISFLPPPCFCQLPTVTSTNIQRLQFKRIVASGCFIILLAQPRSRWHDLLVPSRGEMILSTFPSTLTLTSRRHRKAEASVAITRRACSGSKLAIAVHKPCKCNNACPEKR